MRTAEPQLLPDLSDHLPCLLTVPDIYITSKLTKKTNRNLLTTPYQISFRT